MNNSGTKFDPKASSSHFLPGGLSQMTETTKTTEKPKGMGTNVHHTTLTESGAGASNSGITVPAHVFSPPLLPKNYPASPLTESVFKQLDQSVGHLSPTQLRDLLRYAFGGTQSCICANAFEALKKQLLDAGAPYNDVRDALQQGLLRMLLSELDGCRVLAGQLWDGLRNGLERARDEYAKQGDYAAYKKKMHGVLDKELSGAKLEEMAEIAQHVASKLEALNNTPLSFFPPAKLSAEQTLEQAVSELAELDDKTPQQLEHLRNKWVAEVQSVLVQELGTAKLGQVKGATHAGRNVYKTASGYGFGTPAEHAGRNPVWIPVNPEKEAFVPHDPRKALALLRDMVIALQGVVSPTAGSASGTDAETHFPPGSVNNKWNDLSAK